MCNINYQIAIDLASFFLFIFALCFMYVFLLKYGTEE